MMTARSRDWAGEVLSGRYQVARMLGEGGMGYVYLARDLRLAANVVVKVPRRAMLDDPGFAFRFAREVRSLVQLSHPHVVKISDVGEHEGLPFAVMQYLSGGSLADRPPAGGGAGHAPAAAALHGWLPFVADALDFVHARGYLHRDVKPANILFDGQGHAFLSDFGIAKAAGTAEGAVGGATKTAAGMVLGTPQYMAPEVIMGKPCDGRADQYALAVTVFEALAGRPPFQGPLGTAILVRHSTETPPGLRQVCPWVPEALSAAVQRGLAKDPAERHPDCTALARAVVASAESVVAAPSGGIGLWNDMGSVVRLDCPGCGRTITVPEEARGKRVRCPTCGARSWIADDLSGLSPDGSDAATIRLIAPPQAGSATLALPTLSQSPASASSGTVALPALHLVRSGARPAATMLLAQPAEPIPGHEPRPQSPESSPARSPWAGLSAGMLGVAAVVLIVVLVVRMSRNRPEPIVLAPAADQIIDEGELLTLRFAPNGSARALRYMLGADAPQGSEVDPRTGVFTWKPHQQQGAWRYKVVVHAVPADSPEGPTGQSVFHVTVNDVQPVAPPVRAERKAPPDAEQVTERVSPPSDDSPKPKSPADAPVTPERPTPTILATGQIGPPFERHQAPVVTLAVGSDGQQLLFGGDDGQISLWNHTTHTFFARKFADPVADVKLSADGNHALYLSSIATANYLDLQTKALVQQRLKVFAMSAEVAVNGRFVVAGCNDGSVRFVGLKSGVERVCDTRHAGRVLSVALSADGKTAASGGDDGVVRIWDVDRGRERRSLDKHAAAVSSVALSEDGRRAVSGSVDQTARLWNVETGVILHTFDFKEKQAEVTAVALQSTPGGSSCKILTAFKPPGLGEYPIRLWSWDQSGDRAILIKDFSGHDDSVTCLAFAHRGRNPWFLSGSADKTVRFWNTRTRETQVFRGHLEAIRRVAITADGLRAYSESAGLNVRIWDVTSGAPMAVNWEPVNDSWSMRGSTDGLKVLTVCHERFLRLREGATLAPLGEGDYPVPIHGLTTFSSDGGFVLSSQSSIQVSLRVWDVRTGKSQWHKGIEDLANLEVLARFDPNIIMPGAAGMMPHPDGTISVESAVCWFDGRRALFGCNDGTVRLWDVPDARQLARFAGHRALGFSGTLSADGRRVLTASRDGTARIWDVATGEELHRLTGHSGPVHAVALSLDGHRALTAGADTTVRLWDVDGGREVRRFTGHTAPVRCVAFSPDGHRAFSGGNDHTVRVWSVSP